MTSARDLNSASLAVVGRQLGMAIFVELLLESPDVPLYFCNAAVDIDYGGHTWIGVEALQLGDIQESAGQVEQLQISLPAVPMEYLAIAEGANIRGKQVNVYIVTLRHDDQAVLQQVPIWSGQLDQMPVDLSASSASISATAEHSAVAYGRPKPSRYTDAEQRRLYPGDRALEYLIDQSQTQDVWPSADWFKQ